MSKHLIGKKVIFKSKAGIFDGVIKNVEKGYKEYDDKFGFVDNGLYILESSLPIIKSKIIQTEDTLLIDFSNRSLGKGDLGRHLMKLKFHSYSYIATTMDGYNVIIDDSNIIECA